MSHATKGSLLALLAGLVLLGDPSPRARAQNMITSENPYVMFTPTFSSGYFGYTNDPYAARMNASANMVNAQGNLMLQTQQTYLLKERVKSAKIDNRRKELEQWLWEREALPTLEDNRERAQLEQVRRSRNDPPMTEIWSAKALNDLLLDAQKIANVEDLANTPLNEEMLAKINVTTGKGSSNVGVLRDGMNWPLLLRRKDFATEVGKINKLMQQAVNAGSKEQMDADAIEGMMEQMELMQKKLLAQLRGTGNSRPITPAMYVDAKNFLNQLNDAISLLQKRDASEYLNGKYAAKGKTVGELIKHMMDNGLRFAPATAGNEAAYTALHRALANFDRAAGVRTRGDAK